MKLLIEWNTDSYDCDDCGTSYSEGCTLTMDGTVILDAKAQASCYSGPRDVEYADILYYLCKHLGIEVENDDSNYGVCYGDDYGITRFGD